MSITHTDPSERKNQDIEDFEKLDRLAEEHNVPEMKVAMAQMILIMRNMIRDMTEEQRTKFLNGGWEMVFAILGVYDEPEFS